uniref:Signal peptidase complex subunit 1 n=1 Tax=Rodentolepis nana TaxID=102285 RepID=A0A0R3TJM7_RODNA
LQSNNNILSGQKLAERIMNVVLILFCFIGFIIGYLMEQLSISVVLPPWPMYRRHPLSWQKCEKKHDE